MASALRLMKTMDLDHGVRGIGGLLLDNGVAGLTGYGLGQVYHRYQDKWYGKHAPKILAVVGNVGAIAMQIATGGRSHLITGAMASMGQTAFGIYGMEMGLAHARKHTGCKVVMLAKGSEIPSGAKEVTIGELPPAKSGKGMSFEDIERMAAMH